MSLFLGLFVLKMNSSTASRSRIFQGGNLPALKALASITGSQGLDKSGITVFLTKLKRLLRREYLSFLVDGFRPSVILTRNSSISSDVISDTSRLPNSFWNTARKYR